MKNKVLAVALLLSLLVGVLCVFTSCKRDKNDGQGAEGAGFYTYNDAVISLSANWNPHTYETSDEAYPISYLTTGLYGFIFNDELNPVEGKEAYSGYKIIPEMAADFPVDVTEQIKASHPEFKIPASATSGYAYTIRLNPNARWENGEPITADTYVYSMQMLLDPRYKNYRATDYYSGDFSIAGAEKYATQTVSSSADLDFSEVGLFKTSADDDYSITLVLSRALSGFNLLYNLTGNWIVYKPYYDSLMKPISGTNAYATTYNTSVQSTMSYGPYKLTSYVLDKSMTFEKNGNWYGYTDGLHRYVHPDGNTYDMYQTDKIYCQVVGEADTRKLMFLSGRLMSYDLQADDFAEYRDSEFCYATPSETVFFFTLNGSLDAIQKREGEHGFDKSTTDIETLTLNSFRRAWALSFDKEAFCAEISPSRSGGYGLIGSSYIYDPESGSRYRDTEQAKRALCDFYSVDYTKFDSLDAAVESITGFDVVKARQLYTEAFNEAIERGFITDRDGDGRSDQTVEIVYSSSQVTSFITKTINYFNARLAEVSAGTPFEGKIRMRDAGDQGDPAWVDNLLAGITDTCLCGWSGSALNPFSLTDLYTNPNKQYDRGWFNSNAEMLSLTVNGETVTMSLKQWSDALNGDTVSVGGREYCFGEGIADVSVRLDILAAIEGKILSTYNYIPMLQDANMSLLSKQVFYVLEDYNPIMGRGGIAYLRYNYDDRDWAAYLKSQGGTLRY